MNKLSLPARRATEKLQRRIYAWKQAQLDLIPARAGGPFATDQDWYIMFETKAAWIHAASVSMEEDGIQEIARLDGLCMAIQETVWKCHGGSFSDAWQYARPRVLEMQDQMERVGPV